PIVRNCHNGLTIFVPLNLCFPFCLFCFPKNFFQSLENLRKIFPIVGKTGQNFPTIGNIFGSSVILVEPVG
ncbi:MAG: hypothetical protein IK066_00075, partial [Kiritimatiellae bacterium]|nr:hypothetical protein [Kiritimatiellia bacterium]